MDTKKFKNISEDTLDVVGVGRVEPGEEIEAASDFHNGNFVEVAIEASSRKARGASTESD